MEIALGIKFSGSATCQNEEFPNQCLSVAFDMKKSTPGKESCRTQKSLKVTYCREFIQIRRGHANQRLPECLRSPQAIDGNECLPSTAVTKTFININRL